jgi:hypothetical protein
VYRSNHFALAAAGTDFTGKKIRAVVTRACQKMELPQDHDDLSPFSSPVGVASAAMSYSLAVPRRSYAAFHCSRAFSSRRHRQKAVLRNTVLIGGYQKLKSLREIASFSIFTFANSLLSGVIFCSPPIS